MLSMIAVIPILLTHIISSLYQNTLLYNVHFKLLKKLGRLTLLFPVHRRPFRNQVLSQLVKALSWHSLEDKFTAVNQVLKKFEYRCLTNLHICTKYTQKTFCLPVVGVMEKIEDNTCGENNMDLIGTICSKFRFGRGLTPWWTNKWFSFR